MSIDEINKRLAKYYIDCSKRVIKDFELTYLKVLEAQEQGKAPTPADLYKLDKYWQMQGQLQSELNRLGEFQYNLMFKKFTTAYIDIYNAVAIPGQAHYTQIDRKLAQQVINGIWCADGKSWSQRIWHNTAQLQQKLNDCLVECIVAGRKSSDLKLLLQETFGASYNQANRVVRTEIAHIQTDAAQKRYKDYGITEVEVLADKDERRCELCGALHKKRFPINGSMPVPVHPNCRCCILPVVETE